MLFKYKNKTRDLLILSYLKKLTIYLGIVTLHGVSCVTCLCCHVPHHLDEKVSQIE